MADEEDTKEGEAEEDESEGEGAEEGEEGEEGGKKKKKKKAGGKKKLIIIVAIVLVLLAVAGGGGFYYYKKVLHKTPEVESGEIRKGEESVGPDGKIEQSVFYDMEEFIVNLNVGSKRPSFLKMTVSLELGGESQIPAIESKMPRIRDSFQVYLRELRQEDLQGSAGLYRLREELLLRINKIVYPAKVNDILFKEILIQ